MKRIWQRWGSRAGPNHDKPIPKKVPAPGEWDEDRGQFYSSIFTSIIDVKFGEIVWRKGRWESRFDKVEKAEVIDFFNYGPGYYDYECTKIAYPEEEFKGCE